MRLRHSLLAGCVALLASTSFAGVLGVPQTDYTSTSIWGVTEKWDTSHAGTAPPLSQLAASPTYNLTFNTVGCDIANYNVGASNGAHALYAFSNPNFAGNGGAIYTSFDYPTASPSPVSCPGDGFMHMLANYVSGDGKWHAMSVTTQDTFKEGFSLQNGYFEVGFRLNAAAFANATPWWTSVWGWSRDDQQSPANYSTFQYWEGDIYESGLASATDFTQNPSTFHYWAASAPLGNQLTSPAFLQIQNTKTLVDTTIHTAGMWVSPQYLISYLDGHEIGRFRRIANDLRENVAPQIQGPALYWGPGGAVQGTAYDVMDISYIKAWPCAIQGGYGCTP